MNTTQRLLSLKPHPLHPEYNDKATMTPGDAQSNTKYFMKEL